MPNDPPLDLDTQDEDILITDQNNPRDDSDYPVGPDELGFYSFFLKARDEARERAISKKLHELEQKHKLPMPNISSILLKFLNY